MTLPFSLQGDRYDQSTYWGRCQYNLSLTDPSHVLVSDTRIRAALQMLKAFQEGTLGSEVADEALWEARAIKEGCTRGASAETIPALFRISAFAPVNIPICLLMVQGHTVAAKLFGQWLNQTYNVGVNYCNRGEGAKLELSALGPAYVGAVTGSCAVVYFGTKLVTKTGGLLGTLVPFVAVSGAGVLNVVMTRSSELSDGLALYDEANRYVGMSRAAARDALAKCSLARVIWTAPCIILPSVVMGAIESTRVLDRMGKRAAAPVRLGLNLAVQGLILRYAVPPAMAVFPQRACLPASTLEPEFGGAADPHRKLYFDKGL